MASVAADGINVESELEKCRKAAADGEVAAVLTAIKFCWYFKHPVPAWLTQALGQAAQKYQAAEARTLDEALGLSRAPPGKKWKQPEAAFDSMHGTMCYIEVNRLLQQEKPRYSVTDACAAVAEWMKERICSEASARKVERNYKRVKSLIADK